MKRICLLLFAIAMSVATVSAQEKPLSKSEQRKAQREERRAAEKDAQERYSASLLNALDSGIYYFDAHMMQITNLDRYTLRAPYNVVSVSSGEITVKLPYYTSRNTMTGVPPIIDFRSEDFTMSYKAQKGVCQLTIVVRSVKNTRDSAFVTPSGSYRMVFTIPMSGNGTTRLSLSPSFTSTITYEGATAI